MAIKTETSTVDGLIAGRQSLQTGDPELWRLVGRDRRRHDRTLNFIASENYASRAVLQALASHLNVKYAEGYPRARYYQGVEIVDDIETLAIERAKALFEAEYANVQPYSGSPANMAAYFALAEPGDTLLGMELSHGGHLTHGASVSFSGKLFKVVSYHVDPASERIDFAEVERLAREHRPRLIVAGYSAYPRTIDWAEFRRISDLVGAKLVADIAHIAGLVAGGAHPSPVPYADVVTTTTHKTLRGPRGGLILARAEHGKTIDRVVFPMLQGGPHLSQIAAKAVCFREALAPEFKAYAHAVVRNCQALAEALQRAGFELWSGGTDNHLLVLKLTGRDFSGRDLARALEQAGIVTSMSTIPGEPRSPRNPSGVRFGTPALTSRGATEQHMQAIAEMVAEVAQHLTEKPALARIRKRAADLASELQPV